MRRRPCRQSTARAVSAQSLLRQLRTIGSPCGPIVTLEDGIVRELRWPAIELQVLTDSHGRHVVVLVGAEPDHAWGRFVDEVSSIALDLGARMVVGLGAYPAPGAAPGAAPPGAGLDPSVE